jgi:DNA polymerase III alpha subunit (gram-positive type)
MEVMLDIETLSTRCHATIIAIGAIKFNRYDAIDHYENIDKKDVFYAKIDIDSCKNVDMHIDEKTVDWWNKQDEKIVSEIFSEPREELKKVLLQFRKWFGNSQQIWSHGATFDMPILSEAYARNGLECPWKFWNARDTRTLFDISGVDIRVFPQERLHDPVYDCWRQVCAVKKSFQKLGE